MKRLLSLFTITLSLLLTLPSRAAAASFPDLADHWAAAEVVQAVQAGFVNGYPDGTFRPDETISRAEFVKMLTAGTGLSPNTETARAVVQAAAPYLPGGTAMGLSDLTGHWLYQQGWLEPAVAFGLVVPGDYEHGIFHPDKPITRQEIAVMTVRARGLVRTAVETPAGDLGFSDQAQLPAWVRGYVAQAVKAGILRGYPDGTFGGSQPASRAEAVVMIQRTIADMDQGADPSIQVLVKVAPDREPVPVPLATPARFIDGRVYVPARSVFRTLAQLEAEQKAPGSSSQVPLAVYSWNPNLQEFRRHLTFAAGSTSASLPLTVGALERQLAAPARMAYGELLLPLRLTTPDDSPFYEVGRVYWEPETRRVVIYAAQSYGG